MRYTAFGEIKTDNLNAPKILRREKEHICFFIKKRKMMI